MDLLIQMDRFFMIRDFRFLAIANPKIAPYGIATKETLVSMGLWKDMNKKIVRGENIAQDISIRK